MGKIENALDAAEFFDRVGADVRRSRFARERLQRERITAWNLPVEARRARRYDAETERLRVEMRSVVSA